MTLPPDTTISELVADLDVVGTEPIPWAHLPRRAQNAFSSDFDRWADISTETVASLLSRPKAGEGTVNAVIEAARVAVDMFRSREQSHAPVDAADAVQHLIDQLSYSDFVLLSTRVWPAQKQPREEAARTLDVSAVWITRHQPRAEARFRELLASPSHHAVSAFAAELRTRIGSYAPATMVTEELQRLGIDPLAPAAQLLLFIAGPYASRGQWVENTSLGGYQQAANALARMFAQTPAPTTEALDAALSAAGLAPDAAGTYLAAHAPELRRFGNVWVHWGDTTGDKAEAALRLRSVPTTAEAIRCIIGAPIDKTRVVRETLISDPRFIRTSRLNWALRAWQLPEYRGIAAEISARIDAAGGRANSEQLVDDVLSSLPDIAESSVRTFLSCLAFVNEGGVIRHRTDADEWPPIAPLHTVRGTFRTSANHLRLAVPVTESVLRGSGSPLPPPVADALGVGPGQVRVFSSQHGDVPVAWRLVSTRGPAIGSVRSLAQSVSADLTDTLVLEFDRATARISATRVPADVKGLPRLHAILGKTVRNPTSALATSLGCQPAQAAEILRRRGDEELAELINFLPAEAPRTQPPRRRAKGA